MNPVASRRHARQTPSVIEEMEDALGRLSMAVEDLRGAVTEIRSGGLPPVPPEDPPSDDIDPAT